MSEIVEDIYGSWIPQATPPYEATESKNKFPKQIALGAVAKLGDYATVSYRTEGAKDVGIRVRMTLSKLEASSWVAKQVKDNDIAQKWDNGQSITFVITEGGDYSVTARIVMPNGNSHSAWVMTLDSCSHCHEERVVSDAGSDEACSDVFDSSFRGIAVRMWRKNRYAR